ncbi:inverse autotransporter beta domain-containing protein [Candidatus Pelagibacter sp.]|nr:inverse autotransporter beta domain-containing protein [Candidatus Pelagibacter sp.]
MFRKIILILFFTSSISNAADVSNFFSNLIPGEGLTEASIQINEDDNPDIEILALRDIEASNNSNLFTQFSIHTQETNGNDRLIGNIGIGYRKLSDDKTNMVGINMFFDNDFNAGHQRGSIGLELKGANLDLTANSYHKISNMETYKSTEEQVLSGYTINLASQIPYAPWAKINLQNYSWENEKASSDTEGNSIALEAFLTPSVQIEFKNDMSDNSGVDEEFTSKLTYTYPPREDGKSMQDGFSNVAFEKENVQNKLKDKVNRNNNLTVEVQGSIIVTSK